LVPLYLLPYFYKITSLIQNFTLNFRSIQEVLQKIFSSLIFCFSFGTLRLLWKPQSPQRIWAIYKKIDVDNFVNKLANN
jgi:hypothetical protein